MFASMKVIFFALFYLLQLCKSENVADVFSPQYKLPDSRIVGGSPVNILSYPYQVSLQYFFRHTCGGAVISDRWVLTAAHCTKILSDITPVHPYSIRLGTSFVHVEGQVLAVSRIIEHPGYGNSANFFDYDMALVQVSRAIVFSNSIQPIALPVPHADGFVLQCGKSIKFNYWDKPLIPGSRSVVSGWGTLSEGGVSPTQLHAVAVPLISVESCNEYYQNNLGVTETMICAGSPYGGRDACQGDSGGPLAVDNVLVGIVSWGAGCARPNFPGVYANVPFMREWITEVSGV